jgi:NAD(P)-dependent dehydrogenase (short-subunit alcohol dehydrogenase family)
MAETRKIAIITGAHGGMGRACARQLGRRYDLVLADIDPARLDAFAEGLIEEGYIVSARIAGDLSTPAGVDRLLTAARAAGVLGAVVHTAGLSPSLGGWADIMRINLAGTEYLLRGLEAQLEPGLTAVLIASMAGHIAPVQADIDAFMGQPSAPMEGLAERFLPYLKTVCSSDNPTALDGAAYAQSKRLVIRACEQRAPAWGRKGARICSISPGMIWTPMGRKEADKPMVAALLEATPASRWGTALDIANAADFLTSDLAGFITGCDLQVDGGVTAAVRYPAV